MKTVERISAEGFDYLLAAAGGSVVDGTKFIAAAVNFEGAEAWGILAKQGKIESALSLGCILTLPATGFETNSGAVVTRGKGKLAFANPLVLPQFAVLTHKLRKAFFSAMKTPVSLTAIDLTKADINTAMASLEAHGMTKLGENGSIDLARSRQILETAFT